MAEEQRVERKLACILCADVKDYSALMARDEQATLVRLKADRRRRCSIIPGVEREARIASEIDRFVLVERHSRPLDQVLGAHVLVDRTAPEEAGPDRHGRGQMGLEP